VSDSGVKAAFAELKDEYEENGFVKRNCHQLTHVIGRAADRYGDVPTTHSRGDNFCASGYYHGAIESVVARVEADKIVKIVDEADTICADLRGDQTRSVYHYSRAHGLGHGFMAVLEYDLLESLKACGALTEDEWEDRRCSSGVFMEILMQDRPGHPSRYLKADQPLYPSGEVEDKYKTVCYQRHARYALEVRGNDFAKVLELCATAEDDFRSACYYGLGSNAFHQSIDDGATYAVRTESTKRLCMLGQDREARSSCVAGAVGQIISHYESDTQAKALCESFSARLRAVCLENGEKIYKGLYDRPFGS